MGSEFAQSGEWAEGRSLSWHELDDPDHAGVQRLLRDLNSTYKAYPALWAKDHDPSGFEWIASDDAGHNVISYLRRDDAGNVVVVVVNFSGVPHEDYRLPLPRGRSVDRDPQHRLRDLRRLRSRQPRCGARGVRPVARPAVLRPAPGPAAGRGLPHAGGRVPGHHVDPVRCPSPAPPHVPVAGCARRTRRSVRPPVEPVPSS